MRVTRALCLLLAGAVAAAGCPRAGCRSSRCGFSSAAAGQHVRRRRAPDRGALRDGVAQPVVVENRPGATGRIAVAALKSAPPDGATLLLAPIAVPVIVPLVFKEPNLDPARDLVPIAQVSKYEFAFAVGADHPARTVHEFVVWAKARPAQVTFGTPGAGSVSHFLGVMLGQAAGLELVHVPYRGAAPLESELMSGQITAGVSALSDFLALHGAGKLRILATSGRERSPLLPAVPTFEQGYPSVEGVGWHGIFAPAGTPQPVVSRLSGAIAAALQSPELREKFAALGIEPTGTTPQALAAIIAADIVRWRAIVKATGFSAE
jgi:tripartite-type tricarboxylate transporter receptor subunit TctC